jgi:hypothetical protein
MACYYGVFIFLDYILLVLDIFWGVGSFLCNFTIYIPCLTLEINSQDYVSSVSSVSNLFWRCNDHEMLEVESESEMESKAPWWWWLVKITGSQVR